MSRKPKAPHDDPEESKRFIDLAREVEADESHDAFERAFERVVPRRTRFNTKIKPLRSSRSKND